MFRLIIVTALFVFGVQTSNAGSLAKIAEVNPKVYEYFRQYNDLQRTVVAINMLIVLEDDTSLQEVLPGHIRTLLNALDQDSVALRDESHTLLLWLQGIIRADRVTKNELEIQAIKAYLGIKICNDRLSSQMAQYNGLALTWRYRQRWSDRLSAVTQ